MLSKFNQIMNTFNLQYFGEVSLNKNSYEEDYTSFMHYKGEIIELSLNYEPEEVSESDFIIVQSFFNDFDGKVLEAEQAILKDYKSSGITKNFIQTHLDTLTLTGKEILKVTLAKGKQLDQYFLDELSLNHIWIFPDSADEFIALNFQISTEFTDEILVVQFGKDLKFFETRIEFE